VQMRLGRHAKKRYVTRLGRLLKVPSRLQARVRYLNHLVGKRQIGPHQNIGIEWGSLCFSH